MPARALTGTRIRERRLVQNMRQADLAAAVGISASYLNLIEHNRRRIAGKLLADIARALGSEIAALTQGAEETLIAALRDAAVFQSDSHAEVDRVDEYAGRFPGWAALTAEQFQRIERLERTVETLTDRLTHDPFLSEALHDMLTTVTAIRSTSSILNQSEELDVEWRGRFQKNLYGDSVRLAERSQALVAYLDSPGANTAALTSPQEELEAALERLGDDGLVALEAEKPEQALEALALSSASAKDLGARYLARRAADAAVLPLEQFTDAASAAGYDPLALAERFAVDMDCVLRRLASLPPQGDRPRLGLVICDSSGTLTFRRPLPGFALPRFGAACPIWPLFAALSRPMQPLRAIVETVGRTAGRFATYAVAKPLTSASYVATPVLEATMLIVPDGLVDMLSEPALPVGTSCRICPRKDCAARREASILADGF